jgi:ferredoxin/flavodoxin
MKINTLKLIYFSPTHTTRKVLEAVAQGIEAAGVTHLDLTPPTAETGSPAAIEGDLVIIGVPVYTGRVAQTAVDRIGQLKATPKTPVVLVAVYGNRAFEDALVELKNLAEAAGFTPVAAGAFIGEHSFASVTTPIACGRPDEQDLAEAIAFGRRIRSKLEDARGPDGTYPLQVPGNFPYRERTALPKGSPMTRADRCTLCGTCAEACPTGIITIGDKVITEDAGCIYCCACVKACPTEARVMAVTVINEIADRLSKGCAARRAPEFFL